MADDARVLVLTEMRKQTALLERILAALSPAVPSVDLDGPHGDPVIKAKDPRDWAGGSMRGRTFSECPPEYLDLLAERLDYFASKEEDAKKQKYNLLDAQRARGWAARLRAGWTRPESAQQPVTNEHGDYVASEEPAW